MKLVKVCRASGMPVKLKNIELFKKDYQKVYDKKMQKMGITESTPISEQQSIKLSKFFDRIQKILAKKYPNIEQWRYIKDAKTWEKKVKQHGPIAVAKDSDKGNLVYIILDIPF